MKSYPLFTCLFLFVIISFLIHNGSADNVDFPPVEIVHDSHHADDTLGAFSLASAQLYARLSSISNCVSVNPNSIKNWTCENCKATAIKVTNVTVGETASAKLGYYVGYSPNFNDIIIVFRGSANLENWIADFSFNLVSYPGCSGCRAHEGFIYTYREVRPAIVAAVSGLLSRYPSAKIRITGHSLGAAIATHCAIDFKQAVFAKYEVAGLSFYENLTTDIYNTPIPDGIKALSTTRLSDSLSGKYNLVFPMYNFGGPRVGCPRFASFFQSKIGSGSYFRLTHRMDPVPRVPLPSQGYAHFATEVFFPHEGTNTQYRVCSASNGEDPSCINGVQGSDFNDHRYYAGIPTKHNGSQCS